MKRRVIASKPYVSSKPQTKKHPVYTTKPVPIGAKRPVYTTIQPKRKKKKVTHSTHKK